MQDGTLGVAVIGCGDMGAKHAERWNNLAEARVVAVSDIRPDRGAKLAASMDLARWYDDFHEAVALPAVDVVSVCVPTCLHPDVSIAAARAGKHVLSEKPIALTVDRAEAMAEAAREAGVKLTVGFMRRYSSVLQELRRWLLEGGQGGPVMYHALDARELRPKREMHDPNANGGPVIDMGVHIYDTWAYLFGSQPISVYAQGRALAAGRPEIAHIPQAAVDTAAVQVRYASGDAGSFVVTWGLPPGANPAAVGSSAQEVIYGPRGAVYLDFGIRHQEARLLSEGGSWETLASSDLDMYQCEIEAFARCILEDRPLPVTAEHGRAALKVALAALESARIGNVVRLD